MLCLDHCKTPLPTDCMLCLSMKTAIAIQKSSLTCAATYVRMSTDRQNYSTAHQRDHLATAAKDRGLSIIREYGDEGKSGLALKGRPGLRSLLADVQRDSVPFRTILVYDVSRWGRFQDVDESAHYEFICRSAGVEIIYCAEQFSDDHSPMASLIKSIKRTMAAEYSRELSAKVFKAQCRFVALGYKQGGSAGYGLRRCVVGPDDQPKAILRYGERKGNVTDRVVFVLGPEDELTVLRKIYAMYVDERWGETRIAKYLNAEGVTSEFDRPWTPWMVKSVLTNEKYLGHMIFNRGSFKLHRQAVDNPRAEWVRRESAFDSPLVPGSFELAQAERARRNTTPDPTSLLAELRNLHRIHGKVTTTLLTTHVRSTMPKLLARHFGTITNAYLLAGIPTTSSYAYVAARRFVAETRGATLLRCLTLCAQSSTSAQISSRDAFVINGMTKVRVSVARCRGGSPGQARWKLPTAACDGVDFVIAVQLAKGNAAIQCFYLLHVREWSGQAITLREESPDAYAEYRHTGLQAMFGQGGNDAAG